MKNGFDIHIGLRYPVFFLLMQSKEIRDKVESIYLENEKFYHAMLKDLTSQTRLQNGIQTQTKWYMKILDVIVTDIEKREGDKAASQFVIQLAKISYKRIVDFTENNPQYNPELFNSYILNREPNLNSDTLQLYQFLYLYVMKDKPEFRLEFTPTIKIIFQNMMLMADRTSRVKDALSLKDDEKKQALQAFQELTNTKWRNNENKMIRTIFEDIEMAVIAKNPSLERKFKQTGDTRISYSVKPLSYVRTALVYMHSLGYDNTYFLQNTSISKDDWYEIYGVYLDALNNKGFTEEERDQLLIEYLVQHCYHKNYEVLSEFYLDIKMKENLTLLKNKENELNSLQSEVQEQAKLVEKEKEQVQQAFDAREQAYQEEIQKLKRQLEKSQQENQKLQEQTRLLPAMTNALFENSEERLSDEESFDLESKVLELTKDKKIVLIGGHESYYRKIKSVFSNIYYISPDGKSIGEQQILEADIILFVTHYNNHNQLERMQNLLHEGQKVIFLNKITSLSRTEQLMFKELY